ncbi:MAG: peptidylprolyl isomerase [Planctomycetota bacterium]|nr:peptidylprolyl isomerase [Planctomycetota bacterium]MDP7129939.1 peptidylprolyl isomerase [Planctomycetota bacterium]
MIRKSVGITIVCGFSLLLMGTAESAGFNEKVLKEKGLSGTFAVFHTNLGDFVIKLFKDKVPMTVDNFIGLATGEKSWVDPKTNKRVSRPFYNGLVFHRVIKDFMIQGGCPLGNGRGSPGFRFKDEFHKELKHSGPGILSMANSGPNTNGSQFFITVKATPWLNFKHSVFGKVVLNYEVVDKIGRAATGRGDRPVKDIVIKDIEIIETD